MKVVGLITEYNPFHNGHKYHIEEAKRITQADYVVVVMSGNYVQRGIPAITDKYSRTAMCLPCNVDLVLELPVCYATASAEYFALGAVSLLDNLGIVDCICFGSECGDINILGDIADLLIDEPAQFKKTLSSFVKKGHTYPNARMKALLQHYNQKEESKLADILSSSNNILGIEYLKALKRLKSSIKPYTITRKNAGYHDNILYTNKIYQSTCISSATAIRKNIYDIKDITLLKDNVPDTVYNQLHSIYQKQFPIHENDFSSLLYYKLLQSSLSSLSSYVDVSDDLAKRIKNTIGEYTNYSEYCLRLKSKQYTLTRISRSLLHIMLDIKKDDFNRFCQKGYIYYIRILGFKKESSHIIRQIQDKKKIPVITKASHAKQILHPLARIMFDMDVAAADLYNRVIYENFSIKIPNDYIHGVVIHE